MSTLETNYKQLQGKFDLPEPIDAPFLTEVALHAALSQQIAWMLDHQMDVLLSTLYRMDVLEVKINAALAPDAAHPPHEGLAWLVLDRQKERMKTKQQTQVPPIVDGEDWGW